MIDGTTPSLSTYSSYGRDAGSARVRVFDWLAHLNIKANSRTYLDQSNNSPRSLLAHPFGMALAEVNLRADAACRTGRTVLVSRQASPFSAGHIEARLLRRSRHGVYDFDDALMNSPFGDAGRKTLKQRAWRRAVAAADVVIAGNDHLASAASRFNENVVVIPSCVEPGDYTLKKTYEIQQVPRAVWMGSPATEKYLVKIAKPLLERHRVSGLRLTVISAGSALLGELDQMVDRQDWRRDTFASELALADFGIMPLDDTAWSRGKCAYKLLQYGAAGLPSIGNPVGANTKILELSRGFAPASEAEWADALTSMIAESAQQRKSRGLIARSAVETGFSFASWAEEWTSAMRIEKSDWGQR